MHDVNIQSRVQDFIKIVNDQVGWWGFLFAGLLDPSIDYFLMFYQFLVNTLSQPIYLFASDIFKYV